MVSPGSWSSFAFYMIKNDLSWRQTIFDRNPLSCDTHGLQKFYGDIDMIVKEMKKQLKKSQQETDDLKSLLNNKELTTSQKRSLAAKVLGVHRRYKQKLLIQVTTWALAADNSQASKHKVEKWQETNFGHSISNNELTNWGDSNRGYGERANFEISDETTNVAKELYVLFEGALKNELDESRLRKLSGKILEDELGM